MDEQSPNPFLNRGVKKARQSVAFWRAPQQEKAVAKSLGARQIWRSGAGTKKGDLYIENMARIECKATSQKSFSITRETFAKVENAGLAAGEMPVIAVEFLSPDGKPEAALAVVSLQHLEWLIHAAKANSET